jgi:hypothetical protein
MVRYFITLKYLLKLFHCANTALANHNQSKGMNLLNSISGLISIIVLTSNILVWQARAMEKMGKHWSIPAGRHRFTVPSQPEVVIAEPASNTTLAKTEEYFRDRARPQSTYFY